MKYSKQERAFLQAYRKKKYPRPAVTVDTAVFTVLDDQLHMLLIKRGNFPFQGAWAIPGGFVEVGDTFDDQGEDIETAAGRELQEETGLSPKKVKLHQLATFGKPDRDPRTRIITVVYLALLSPDQAKRVQAGDDAAAAEWVPLTALKRQKLAFDHRQVVRTALRFLGREIERTGIIKPLLPAKFLSRQLRQVFAAIWADDFEQKRYRRVFRRLLEDGVVRRSGVAKPQKYLFG